MNVLIVEDSVLIQERLRVMISEIDGIGDIRQAYDAVEGEKLLKEMKPDFLILDIRMPRGSGLTVLNSIASESSKPEIVVFTNYPYPQYRNKCLSLGVNHFFDKATELEKVINTLKDFVAKQPAAITQGGQQ